MEKKYSDTEDGIHNSILVHWVRMHLTNDKGLNFLTFHTDLFIFSGANTHSSFNQNL